MRIADWQDKAPAFYQNNTCQSAVRVPVVVNAGNSTLKNVRQFNGIVTKMFFQNGCHRKPVVAECVPHVAWTLLWSARGQCDRVCIVHQNRLHGKISPEIPVWMSLQAED